VTAGTIFIFFLAVSLKNAPAGTLIALITYQQSCRKSRNRKDRLKMAALEG